MLEVLEKAKEMILRNFKEYEVGDAFFGEGYNHLCTDEYGQAEIGETSIFVKQDDDCYLNIRNAKAYQLAGRGEYLGGKVIFDLTPFSKGPFSLRKSPIKSNEVRKLVKIYLNEKNNGCIH